MDSDMLRNAFLNQESEKDIAFPQHLHYSEHCPPIASEHDNKVTEWRSVGDLLRKDQFPKRIQPLYQIHFAGAKTVVIWSTNSDRWPNADVQRDSYMCARNYTIGISPVKVYNSWNRLEVVDFFVTHAQEALVILPS